MYIKRTIEKETLKLSSFFPVVFIGGPRQIGKTLNELAEMIVELAGNGLNIFESSKKLEKNQLLKILVSNCVLDNKKARISLYEPFNLLLKNPSCPMWSK